MRVLEMRALPILAQVLTYSPTMHRTAVIRHMKRIRSSIKICRRIHSVPILLFACTAVTCPVSAAVVAEEGTTGSSTDRLIGLFDPLMLRKMGASDGRRGDDFGAENDAG